MRTANAKIVSSDVRDLGTATPFQVGETDLQKKIVVIPSGMLSASFVTPAIKIDHLYGFSVTVTYAAASGSYSSGSISGSTFTPAGTFSPPVPSGFITIQGSNDVPKNTGIGVPVMQMSGGQPTYPYNGIGNWADAYDIAGNVFTQAVSASVPSPTGSVSPTVVMFNCPQQFYSSFRLKYDHTAGSGSMDSTYFGKGNQQ